MRSKQINDLSEQYFQPKIDLIQHVIQYSQNIILITAAAGGGKTAFAHFCLNQDTPQLKKHLLIVTPTLSLESMMENIAEGFGMSWPKNSELVTEKVQKIWTLFVEDAHLLHVDMLEALVRLINFHQEPKKQLHLVLLGEEKLRDQFLKNTIINLVGNYSTVIELDLPKNWKNSFDSSSSFTKTSRTDLLEKESKESKESEVNVDLIDKMDVDLLDNMPESSPRPKSVKNIFFHPIAYGLYLGLFFGIGLWVWQGIKLDPEEQIGLLEESEILENIPTIENTEETLLFSGVTASAMSEEVDALSPIKAAIQEPSKPKPAIVKENKIQKPVKVLPQAISLMASEKTVLAKNKSHYTIQLYSSNELQKVTDFKKTHGLNKAWIVRKKHQGKIWHILVMGDYASKIQAEKANKRLPESLSQAKITP